LKFSDTWKKSFLSQLTETLLELDHGEELLDVSDYVKAKCEPGSDTVASFSFMQAMIPFPQPSAKDHRSKHAWKQTKAGPPPRHKLPQHESVSSSPTANLRLA
jgi:hypothetical protein